MTAVPAPPTTEREQAAGSRVARLYERHGRPLYGLCLMVLRDPHDAEDALQSTFLSAHRALVGGTEPRDESAWIAAIARNECRGRLRARSGAAVSVEHEALEAVPDPAPPVEEQLRDPEVERALAALSPSQREAVVLHDVLGLRSREVGAALGLSVGAVEALLFRARRQLRLRLRPAGLLVVPAAVGEALTQAIPGFVAPAAAAGAAGAAGVAGVGGLLAKLTGAPAAAKVAAGVATVVTAGSVVAVEQAGPARTGPEPARASLVQQGDADAADGRDDHGSSGSSRSGRDGDRERVNEDGRRDSSGPGSGDDGGDRSGRSGDDDRDGDRSGSTDDSASRAPDDGERSGRGGGDVDEKQDDPEERSGTGSADHEEAADVNLSTGESSETSGSSEPGSGTETEADDTTRQDDRNSGPGGGTETSGSSGSSSFGSGGSESSGSGSSGSSGSGSGTDEPEEPDGDD